MVRDANGRIQAIVSDIPGLLCVKCVGRCFSGNLYELQFLNRRKTAWLLFRSFIERYMKISFGGVFFVFSFQLSDNSHQVFRNLRAGERTLDSEICFQNFLDRTADFYQHFYGFHISIFSSHFSGSNSVTFLCNTTLVGGFSSYVIIIPVAVISLSPINIFPQIRDS